MMKDYALKTIDRLYKLYEENYTKIHKKYKMPIEELLGNDTMTKYHHPLTALRYLFLEEYIDGIGTGINTYTEANKKSLISEIDIMKDREKFKRLIQSFQNIGYNGSAFEIDQYGNVRNGTHRLALCIFYGIKSVYVCERKRNYTSIPNAETAIGQLNIDSISEEMLKDCYDRMYRKVHSEK